MKPTLLVLAAGMGSRYGGLKQMDSIGPSDETIIDYSIHDAITAGFGKIVFVIREDFEKEFKAIFNKKLAGRVEIEYVNQAIDKVPMGSNYNTDREKPWGTGHAILMAEECINEPFAVINADDYYGIEAFVAMADFLKNSVSEQEYSMVGYQLANTISENGSVSRGICMTNANQHLLSIVERTHIEKLAEGIAYKEGEDWIPVSGDTIVSMNFWGFTPELFAKLKEQFVNFLAKEGQALKSEFYIPLVVAKIIADKEVNVKVLESEAQWFGVTYFEDREKVVKAISNLVEQGVYPCKLWD